MREGEGAIAWFPTQAQAIRSVQLGSGWIQAGCGQPAIFPSPRAPPAGCPMAPAITTVGFPKGAEHASCQ